MAGDGVNGEVFSELSHQALIHDVFRRADKNDDNALSWNEFRTFFAEGGLGKNSLFKLFNDIDTKNTNNIDIDELSAFFSQNLGHFQPVFDLLAKLNTAVSKALQDSAKSYPEASETNQFATRFLLREVSNHMTATQAPVDNASDALDGDARKKLAAAAETEMEPVSQRSTRISTDGVEMDGVVTAGGDVVSGSEAPSGVRPGRIGRRQRRNYNTQTSWPAGSGVVGAAGTPVMGMEQFANLERQVDRLNLCIDRIEKRINFDGVNEEVLNIKQDKMLILVRRQFLLDLNVDDNKTIVKSYINNTEKLDDTLHVSIRTYTNSECVVIYEMWDNDEARQGHQQSDIYKVFSENVSAGGGGGAASHIDVSSLIFPNAWWVRDY